jgi:hypothetical protein
MSVRIPCRVNPTRIPEDRVHIHERVVVRSDAGDRARNPRCDGIQFAYVKLHSDCLVELVAGLACRRAAIRSHVVTSLPPA